VRKIIHADCDSFFASVEVRDNPSLSGKPIAVGGAPDQRGVVATCSYEARRFGVHSAMPMSQALRACPDLIVIPTNMARYREVSAEVREIFERYTEMIEPLSLDEAFLDVTATTAHRGSGTLIATEIRDSVRRELGITISAGIAPNKFLAKIASDWKKPDGQFTIRPEEVDDFVAALPVEKLHGVGEATTARLHARGLKTCADIRPVPLGELMKTFGSFGGRLYQLCRGIDDRPVKTHRVRKSVSVERTYAEDLTGIEACRRELETLMDDLTARIDRAGAAGRIDGCFVKVRFSGFETTTASCPARGTGLAVFEELLSTAWERGHRPVRLLGLGVRLHHPAVDQQLGLFGA
jgi:DNA polymerase-4